MNINIDEKSSHKCIYIDDIYKLFIVDNVIRYSYNEHTTYNIHVSSIPTTTNTSIEPQESSTVPHYLFIDLIFHEAFSHWIFESAIYLPIFKHLKKIYNNLILVLNGRKQFKSLFLKFFEINESDVMYAQNIGHNNVCIFPSPISSLNNHTITETYKQIVHKFVRIFQTYTHAPINHIYDCIVMPRQKKENFRCNDRTYDLTHIYTYLNEKNKKYKVINTDEIIDLKEQIQSIRTSSNIILTDGSPFLVNNMFCMKSKLFVIGSVTISQYKQFAKMKFLIDSISELNENTFEYIGNNVNLSI